ncbi:MAG: ABC transporter substrate-binding protein [Clostridia bacterium]|nr:ABC transporter substrate-binding protein [Clostridia bacterium]
MKKIICVLLLICLFATCLVACGPKDEGTIRLNEVTHSVFYAPLYVAIEQGYFEEYGINIELTNGGGADKSMTAVISGQADIGLMGPEAAIYIYNEGRRDYPVIFGQLTRKDGSFIVAREPIENFTWADMENKEILGGRRGGAPAMALEYALKKNNLVDKTNITVNYDVQYDLMTSAFDSGVGDFCTMFEPAASNFVKAGKGAIVASVGQMAGDMPFTAFMATKSYLKDNQKKVENFMKAIKKGMDFVKNHTPEEIAEALKNSFDGTSVEILASAIKSYKDIDAFMDTPVLKESDFERLQDVIVDAGVMTKRAVFSDVVDNSIASRV